MSKPVMNPNLPESIAAYFSARSDQDTDAILACFTPTATVIDEGENQELIGHQAIQRWLEGPVAEYKLTTEVTRSSEKDGQVIVTALVSGDFPGSPIEFEYQFHLKDGKIDRLLIS
jgi:ketosteroid isomerase-like protein